MSRHAQAINTILFDWDGTLADSAALGFAAFQKTFAELGLAFSLEAYETTYSPNWYWTYEALGLPRDKWQKADELWMQYYGEKSPKLIEGAAETLLDLHRRGYQMGVVSSGSESRVCREIEKAQVARVFTTIICNEQMENKKPHPEGLQAAMDLLQADPARSAYVGDAPEDIEMGKRAGVLTIAVRSSYPCNSKLAASHPDIFLESLAELAEYFPAPAPAHTPPARSSG